MRVFSNNNTGIGLICGNNAGTVNVRAISYSPSATATLNKNFAVGAGAVVYVAYGAETPYKANGGYQAEYDGEAEDDFVFLICSIETEPDS